ncbi:Hypothetical predicted protein [Mytilus galloprovincialis]|uniref:Endonuclease/exonuclease/phosphatase domain-containing protein n=1 Tax=Mytilus galloprovincialis TaxID=29158 RepID=A0A8B6GUA5_MYTGA|nr:Hypothetical predicted protein [Mytilus galloprovincialis]
MLYAVVHEEFGKEISNFKKQINQDIGNIKSDLDKLTKSYAEVAKPSANNKNCNIVIKNLAPCTIEINDPSATMNTVNKLLRDGLKLTDIKVSQAKRIRESVLNYLNLDIIGVCETFLKNDDNIEISGYQWYGHNRKFKNAKTKRGSGGVGVLIKVEVLDNFSVSILDSSVEDILWIKLSHKYDDLLQQVYCYQNEGFVYIGGDVNSRCGSEQDYIQGVDDINDREIIDVSSNKYGDLLIDFLTSCNLCMLNGRADGNNDFTCVSKRGRSVVDYVFAPHEQLDMCTSCDVYLMSNLIVDTGLNFEKSIPDHGPIVWTVNVKKDIACDTRQAPNTDRPRYNLKRFPLNFLNNNKHIQNTIDKIENELSLIQKEMKDTVPILKTPTGPSSNKRKKSLRKPYWTEELTSLWNKVCIKEKQWLKCKNCTNLRRKLKQEFCNIRNQFDKLNRNTKRKFQLKEQDNLSKLFQSNNTRDFWKYIGNIGIANERRQNIPFKVKTDEGFSSDVDVVLDKWKTDYEKLFNSGDNGNFDNNHLDWVKGNNHVFPTRNCDTLNCPVTRQDVIDAVNRTKLNKAVGFDYIPAESLRNSICIDLLFKLISFCFQNGKVPDLWLNGIINPIPKNDSGCKFDPISYRGITILSIHVKFLLTF